MEVELNSVLLGRFRALGMHLAVSLLILFALYALLRWVWYPGVFFEMAGGWEGFRILLAVDLVIGPCLTFVVFNNTKSFRHLARDLSIVAFIQAVFLAVGVTAVFHSRPLAVVHVFDTFYVLNHEALDAAGVSSEQIQRVKGGDDFLYYVDVPQAKAEFLKDHVKSLVNGELPLQFQVDRYLQLPKTIDSNILHGETASGCLRVDLESAYRQGAACFDPKTQEFSSFVAK